MNTPEAWWISWIGSWFIIFMTLTGRIFEVASGGSLTNQILRPWMLMHLIYAGYGFMTSIFYWMDLNGWYYLSHKYHTSANLGEVSRAAEAQVYYVLSHAALVTGFSIARRPSSNNTSKFTTPQSMSGFLIKAAGVAFLLGASFRLVPGLAEFSSKFTSLGVIAGAFTIGVTLQERSMKWFPVAVLLNCLLLLSSVASAMKEDTIMLLVINALAFFPVAPWRTATLSILVFAVCLIILPSISNSLRRDTWFGNFTTKEALPLAYSELLNKDRHTLAAETWTFLVNRFSEQNLFIRYLDSTPKLSPFQGLTIVKQSLLNLIPRILWPEKPNTERFVMARVYDNGVVLDTSNISAKPQFVVDGYLTMGAFGVWLSGIFYGFLAITFSRQCEEWLGGYLFGGISFNGLFSIMLRGNCWEFFLNQVLWSFFLICVLRTIGQAVGWLRPASSSVRKPSVRPLSRSKDIAKAG